MSSGIGRASESARATYMIALTDAPLVADAQNRVHAQRVGTNGATSATGERQAMRAALAASASKAYLRGLDARRGALLSFASGVLGRPLAPSHVYRYAINGMSLELSDAEAAQLATLPGVKAISKERTQHLLTDAGPQWIGADVLWQGQVDGVAASKGDGVVIGIIDSGINPTHPSFAATGPDGYKVANPRGRYYGLCASGQAACNDKLIGIYDFSSEGTSGIDVAGHGSHVSGIAAGNATTATLHGYTQSISRPVSGVAPHANVIMYKACNAQPLDPGSDGTCSESWLVGAIDQAIADNVDVINYSIGGDGADPYVMLNQGNNDVAAFFAARAAGIVVVAAAGNEGPGANTVSDPAYAPWVVAVANATHNRQFGNALSALSGADGAPADLAGQSLSSGYGPADIVYAGNFGSALCGKGATQGVTPSGASNPFAQGTFHGEIVVCDRGVYARVEKGYNVLAAGAGGMILANAASDGESVVADNHFLPAVHLGYDEGQRLEQWLARSGSHRGTITAATAALMDSLGDVLNASSSRGPYGFSGGVLKPDITAPGTNILSAANTGGGLAILTGTSMASPHVAGAAALLLSAHPDWGPAQVESALMGTALAGSVRGADGVTPASPVDAGAGRAQPARAANAGLYLPLAGGDFYAGGNDPLHHGNLRLLNRAGLTNEHCFQSCSFSRTVADLSGGGTWEVATSATIGAHITVTPTEFTLAQGATQALTISIDVSDPRLPKTWVAGNVRLHKTGGGSAANDFALTAAVFADPGSAPAFLDVATQALSGNTMLSLSGLPALPSATFAATTFVTGATQTLQLPNDPSPGTLYTLPGAGKQVILLPHAPQTAGVDNLVMANGRVQFIEVTTPDALEVDLIAGIDTNNDGVPEQSEQLCKSSTTAGGASARCIIDLAGVMQPPLLPVWIIVDTFGKGGGTFTTNVTTAQPYVSALHPAGNAIVTGPGHVAASAPFSARLAWNLPAAGRYFGAALVDGAAGLSGQSGLVPVALTIDPASPHSFGALVPGANYLVQLNPGEAMTRTFVDVPQGVSTMSVTVNASPSASVAMNFSATRVDFPPFSNTAQIVDGPAPDATTVSWSAAASGAAVIQDIAVTPGRWYLGAAVAGNAAQSSTFSVGFKYADAASSQVVPGAYYDPQRSGHGIFLSQVSGQQGLDWYTYLEDGTPTWYQAQAPAPASPAWSAPLLRVNWDGTKVNSRTLVGDVVLTPIDGNDAVFSWHLDGVAGSERFTRLGAGACPTFAGVATNFNGAWYAPAQSGYGMDVGALPDLQFAAFYFYDDVGIARWGSGSVSPFAASSTLPLTQNHGFCPVCDYVAVTTRPLGTLAINYASATAGTYASSLILASPLSGAWSIAQPIARLTGSSSCGN